jgi:hypothetical protein
LKGPRLQCLLQSSPAPAWSRNRSASRTYPLRVSTDRCRLTSIILKVLAGCYEISCGLQRGQAGSPPHAVRAPNAVRPPDHRFEEDAGFATGGTASRPRILGIGAVSGHHEHRSPRTRVATDARGWRSTFRRSIARLVPRPGQNTSSQGLPASRAARIVGDQSISRLRASWSFQRWTTASASARAALSAASRLKPACRGPASEPP